MVHKFIEIKKDIDSFEKSFLKIANQYDRSVLCFKVDCFMCRIFHGALAEQYISFKMWSMSHLEKKQFVTAKRSEKIERIFNTQYDPIIDRKHLFNSTYAKYIKRSWIYVPDHTDDEIIDFLRATPDIIVKKTKSSKGRGIQKLRSDDVLKGDIKEFISSLRESESLIEAKIEQNKILDEINSTSTNSLRIATVRDSKGEVHVVGASLKIGRAGQFVDNYHAGALQFPVSIDKGIVTGAGVDINGEAYFCHPDSGKTIVGMQIPNWNIILDTVKEAALIPKNSRYLGWDVAILEDSCELIECNTGQGCNGMQLDGVGKYSVIMKNR